MSDSGEQNYGERVCRDGAGVGSMFSFVHLFGGPLAADREAGDLGSEESRSASRSGSAHGSGKSARHTPARSRSKEDSRRSRSKSRSRSESRSRSRRSSRRHYTRSRSRSRSHRRSRSRSYSRDYRRRHSHSHSPMSTRRRHVGNRANPDPNCCLGVFGLSLYTTERDLREVFSKYGPIADVSIVYDQQSRRSRGFAFVYFENVDDAKEAKERANGMELDGRRIRVDFSITKRPHTPTPGIYMGRPTYGSSRRRDYYDRGYDRGYDDRDYYSRSYRGGGGGGGGWRAAQDRDQIYRRRSPSPYYSRGGYRSRSRSRSYSPRKPLLKHEVEDFLKHALELGYRLWTIFFIVSCLKSEQCLVKLGDFYTFYDDYFWWS
ncbi:transformer-2 protein homolog beta [Orycteropus afer afer]|uniref:Transformer-2 protein homolog beta n=1 Tax=Orycteropus afer afer TaxID=1230840 RepID=A0AC54Z0N6_ORYAF|nr:transformer-2 protein homolog beta [Orycteropus afer afer]